MTLVLCATALSILSLVAAAMIVVHAFRRSVGTGVMVLLIPAFIVYYAFTQFEHRRKGAVVAVWLGGLLLGSVLDAYVARALFTPPPEVPSMIAP